MPQLIEDEEALFDPIEIDRIRREERRRKLITALPEIADRVTGALADANLDIPIFLSIPRTGDSLLTFATPIDPSDEDWGRACMMVRSVIEAELKMENLNISKIPCISAGKQMGAAEFTAADAGLKFTPV